MVVLSTKGSHQTNIFRDRYRLPNHLSYLVFSGVVLDVACQRLTIWSQHAEASAGK